MCKFYKLRRWTGAALVALLACGMLSGCIFDYQGPDISTSGQSSSASLPESISSSPGSTSSQAAVSTPAGTKLTVPEGFTLARIGMTLEEEGVCTADEFIAAAQDGDYSAYPLVAEEPADPNICFKLEGYLFPATYELPDGTTPDEIIRMMLGATESRITGDVRAQIAASGFTTHQILTLASMIEKESFGTEIMPMVSSVFHNRIKAGMKLQSDPTITYVEGAIKPFITGDVDRYNEFYNTYKCAALPAGPICNPGMAAIQAALAPAETDYLFFLTDADNNFHFTADYDEHLANVDKYLE